MTASGLRHQVLVSRDQGRQSLIKPGVVDGVHVNSRQERQHCLNLPRCLFSLAVFSGQAERRKTQRDRSCVFDRQEAIFDMGHSLVLLENRRRQSCRESTPAKSRHLALSPDHLAGGSHQDNADDRVARVAGRSLISRNPFLLPVAGIANDWRRSQQAVGGEPADFHKAWTQMRLRGGV